MIISPFYRRGNRDNHSPKGMQLRKGPRSSESCRAKPTPHPLTPPGDRYPVASAMTQPPCSASASMQQPSGSWLRPRLWPISWAMVTAAPMGSSEWSWEGAGTVTTGFRDLLNRHHLHLSSGLILGQLTVLTPPELSAWHIPSTGARPTVLP